MIILNRKKILYIMGVVSIFIFTYMLTGYNVSTSKNNSNIDVETVQTVALPVNSKVIVIDAGHGVPDEGAESSSRYNRSRK